jgi:alkanesulfonate monooxygenase SsuD/methylene tetrahydromethanopterin reductase-like flavin-dependent oxidoreductase (luciferase family)
VLPKPVQRPHPPVWLAASSPEAVQRAAESGFSILMDPHASHAEPAGSHRPRHAAHGHSHRGRRSIARMIASRRPTPARLPRAGAQWTPAARDARHADPDAAVNRYVNEVGIRSPDA